MKNKNRACGKRYCQMAGVILKRCQKLWCFLHNDRPTEQVAHSRKKYVRAGAELFYCLRFLPLSLSLSLSLALFLCNKNFLVIQVWKCAGTGTCKQSMIEILTLLLARAANVNNSKLKRCFLWRIDCFPPVNNKLITWAKKTSLLVIRCINISIESWRMSKFKADTAR